MNTSPKFSTVTLVATVSALACLGLSLFTVLRWMEHKRNPYEDRAFDAAVWRSAQTYAQREQRAKMAGDIRKHYLKAGMTYEQIVALLGPPDKPLSLEGFGSPNQPEVKEIYQYDMGPAWGDMAGQHENLRLSFDAKRHLLFSYLQVD